MLKLLDQQSKDEPKEPRTYSAVAEPLCGYFMVITYHSKQTYIAIGACVNSFISIAGLLLILETY